MDDDVKKTIYAGGLSEYVSEDILYELCLQAGPINYVKIPLDKNTGKRKAFGFVCFQHECTVPFAIHMLNGIGLCGKNLNVQSRDKTPLIPADFVGVHRLPEINDEAENMNDIDNMSRFFGNNNVNYPDRSSLRDDLQKRLGNRQTKSQVADNNKRKVRTSPYSRSDKDSRGNRYEHDSRNSRHDHQRSHRHNHDSRSHRHNSDSKNVRHRSHNEHKSSDHHKSDRNNIPDRKEYRQYMNSTNNDNLNYQQSSQQYQNYNNETIQYGNANYSRQDQFINGYQGNYYNANNIYPNQAQNYQGNAGYSNYYQQ